MAIPREDFNIFALSKFADFWLVYEELAGRNTYGISTRKLTVGFLIRGINYV